MMERLLQQDNMPHLLDRLDSLLDQADEAAQGMKLEEAQAKIAVAREIVRQINQTLERVTREMVEIMRQP